MKPTLDSHGGHETFFSLFLICRFSFVIYLWLFKNSLFISYLLSFTISALY